MPNRPAGLFITGSDTDVGKTYVAALIVGRLVAQGRRVGVYKPVASGCSPNAAGWVSQDALELWEAAGRPLTLEAVCPQRFAAPLAPHLAARAEGREVDAARLLGGLDSWRAISDVLIVEGAGGLLSPLTPSVLVADLALEFRLPLVVVVRDALGAINQTLQTLHVARTYRGGLPVAAVVLNRLPGDQHDPSTAANAAEIARLAPDVPLVRLEPGAAETVGSLDWFRLAAC